MMISCHPGVFTEDEGMAEEEGAEEEEVALLAADGRLIRIFDPLNLSRKTQTTYESLLLLESETILPMI